MLAGNARVALLLGASIRATFGAEYMRYVEFNPKEPRSQIPWWSWDMQFAEIEFRYKGASVSTAAATAEPSFAKAIDGLTSTKWHSNSKSSKWVIDLEQATVCALTRGGSSLQVITLTETQKRGH